MNGDKFDKELAALYQQRKADVIAPEVKFEHGKSNSKYSPLKLLTVLFIAGTASFGIMAIVSHFANQTPENTKGSLVRHVTEIIKLEPPKELEKEVLVTKTLPTKPEVINPKIQQAIKPQSQPAEVAFDVDIVNTVSTQIIALPKLTKPTVTTMAPTYKVLPKYPLDSAQAGIVDLSYQVNKDGSVSNIKVIESDVNRPLQRSAEKALEKWRYLPQSNPTNELQVRFIFTSPESQ